MRTFLAVGLALAICAPASASTIYKWVDDKGNTHFGSQAPSHVNATPVKTHVPLTHSTAPTTPPVDPQLAVEEQVKQDVAANAKKRQEYCQTQRNNLAQLNNNPRVNVEVEGEVRRLGEEERQSRIAETKKAIADNCDPA